MVYNVVKRCTGAHLPRYCFTRVGYYVTIIEKKHHGTLSTNAGINIVSVID